VVAEAARLADEVGPGAVTLAAIAQRLGVALPSLYKHVRGLDAVLQKVSALAVAELGAQMSAAAAGRAGADALRAVADAYRAYALRHPGRYALCVRAPDPDDPEHVAAGQRAVDVAFAVLRGYGLKGDAAIDATRAFRSALHGFIALEQAGGFGLPREVERSYNWLVTALDTAYRARPA
jgi:AcrR family transcriptional regulator